MPQIRELFGFELGDLSTQAQEAAHRALCPYTLGSCDGGGNRHQTTVVLTRYPDLQQRFHPELDRVVPGVCSIATGEDVWVVCPRRLFGFSPPGAEWPTGVNTSLQEHERQVLIAAGTPTGVDLGIWSEVSLKYKEDGAAINYHFDYVIVPLRREMPSNEVLADFSAPQQRKLIVSGHLQRNILPGVSDSKAFRYFPDLTAPLVIEVMTASTTGSNTAAGTDIASAFMNALLGRDHSAPGINKRQVWGRMTTQLFAKAALASKWGGKVVWVVQDQLIADLQLTTKFVADAPADGQDAIHFAILKYGESPQRTTLTLDRVSSPAAGIAYSGSGTCTDVLLPKVMPNQSQLLKALLQNPPAAIVNL